MRPRVIQGKERPDAGEADKRILAGIGGTPITYGENALQQDQRHQANKDRRDAEKPTAGRRSLG